MSELFLNENGLNDKMSWMQAGYTLPAFDREKITANTKKSPKWIHFGAGNIFRAFQANACQKMINQGLMDTGLIVAEGFDYEIIEKSYRPMDNYSILVTLKADGSIEKTVIGSIVESCILDSENDTEYSRLKEIFENDSLQMASFTITEKGYSLVNGKGEELPAVTADFENGPEKPQSYIGKVASLLYARFKAGAKPIAMVSMDNCSHNGEKLQAAIVAFAKKWEENNVVEKGFTEYVENPEKVSFPWSMIDKITPRPDSSVEEMLAKDGLKDLEPIVTSKNTYVAPFVNAEESEYLVIEDAFPNGRPELEKVGLIFTDRETVNKVEKMKVCTCLNPLHTSLAVFGCLLGFTKIADEMKDEALVSMVKTIGYKEGLPVVVDPKVIKPDEFIDTVVNVRIPNPFMPDTPQRIATDTSQKLPIRFGETIKAYQASDKLDVSELKLIPLVFAGWIRYLMAIDDEGNKFELSSDPRIESLKSVIEQLEFGKKYNKKELEEIIKPILTDKTLFGVDLTEVGMSDLVCDYLVTMLSGKGEIRKLLDSLK
ncbi:MAG: mannitol dehydrogenase family protein [Butyrivibrio sp.]|nr:mannitol dehydrogenase family protein [Butyrivibrio sp.]